MSQHPTCPIPTDRRHEFFSEPLKHGDPALVTWRKHFKQKHVPIVEKVGPWGVQFYLHRATIVENGTRHVRWCCREQVTARPLTLQRV